MKYCHGTDSRWKDMLRVWFICVMTCTFVAVALFLILAGCYYMATGDPVWVCVFMWLMATVFIFGALDGIWTNGRYSVDAEGVSLSTFLKDRTVSWTEVQEIGIFPVLVSRNTSKDYFLIYVRGKNKDYQLLDLTKCWVNSDDMLAIRCTDERLEELEKVLGRKIQRHIWNGSSGKYEIKQDDSTRKDAE